MTGAGALRRLVRGAQRSEVAVGLVVTGVALVGRFWARAGAAPLVWNDSADYVDAASSGLLSPERLVGSRPALMPLLLSAASLDPQRFARWQALLASVAWGLLAAAVASVAVRPGAKAVGAISIAVVSLTWPVSIWDQQILTESLALTTLVLAIAAGIWFVRTPTPTTATLLVAAAGGVLASRDSLAIPVALVGVVLLLVAVRREGGRRRLLVLTGAYLLALTFLFAGAARHGERNLQPLEHVYAVRVLPYPDRVAWFAERGMPQATELAAIPKATDPVQGFAPFTPVPKIEQWAPWRAWLEGEGQLALARYALAHPGFVFQEPLARPERVFNNAGGLDGYRPVDQRDVPIVGSFATIDTAVVVVAALTAGFVLALLGDRRHPLVVVGAILALTAAPHGLAVWHLDGMESARHLLVPGVQLRIGTILLVTAALDAVLVARGTAPSPPARWPDRRPGPHPRPA